MENNSTPITNLNEKNDSKEMDNSKEIDNIINQIQNDNESIKKEPQFEQPPDLYEEHNEQEIEEPEYTVYDVIYNEVSYPILVMVLFVILSLPQLDKVLCGFINFICSEEGTINIFGILLKSLIMGMLFYIFGKYVV